MVVAVAAEFVVAAALRFAFDLLDFAFIHSSTAPNRASKSFISTGSGSLCGVTSNGYTLLLPLLSVLIHHIISLSASGK